MRKCLLAWLGLCLVLAACGGNEPATGALIDPSAVQVGVNPVLDTSKPVVLGEALPDLSFELNGKPVKLSDFRGKTVVLNFWATWCAPCRLEMPDFEALSRSRPDVAIIGINLRENDEQVRKFASEVGASFPLILDRTGDIAANFGVTLGLPTTYFVDANGVVQKIQLQAMTRSQITKYIDDLAPPK